MLLLAQMITAFCAIRTVNLKQVANAITGKAKSDSNYRKLQRFFALTELCYNELARYIVRLFFNETTDWYLTMDRTNWQYGRANINILVLGICYKGRAIPILWKLLDKKGNSNTQERIELLSRFLNLYGHKRIKALLADREFIGQDWLSWLNKQQIPFNIRLKKNEFNTNSRGLSVYIDGLFYHLKANERVTLQGQRLLWGEQVYLSGLRLTDGELLLLATSHIEEEPIDIYSKRWEIETLFECLKGRGFNFEDTRLTELERVNRMVAVLAISYCWAHKAGEWRSEQGDGLKYKKHGRLEKSLFRHGLDLLQQIMLGTFTERHTIRRCINLLKPRDVSPPDIPLVVF